MIEELRSLSIVAAALEGDADTVHWLIETGQDIETRDGEEDTPLLAAAVRGHLDVVRYLLGRGADSRATNKSGRTALMAASQSGSLTVAETFLTLGAKVNLGDKNGKTPLMYAAAKGGIDMVKFLIAQGALVEAQDKDSYNALFYAANFGQASTTNYLLEHYAKELLGGWVNLNNLVSAAINATNCTLEMAEGCAIFILRAIGIRGASILVPVADERGPFQVPLLTYVINNKKYSKDLIKAVLTAGADPNGEFICRDIELGPMLFAAVAMDRPDAVEALIEAGAAINAPWRGGNFGNFNCPLVVAIGMKREACIAALLRGGADITAAISDSGFQTLTTTVTESQIVRRYLGVLSPSFALTTTFARHMNQLETLEALRFDASKVISYFAAQLPKAGGCSPRKIQFKHIFRNCVASSPQRLPPRSNMQSKCAKSSLPRM